MDAGKDGHHGEAEGQEEALRRDGRNGRCRLARRRRRGRCGQCAAPQPPQRQQAQALRRQAGRPRWRRPTLRACGRQTQCYACSTMIDMCCSSVLRCRSTELHFCRQEQGSSRCHLADENFVRHKSWRESYASGACLAGASSRDSPAGSCRAPVCRCAGRPAASAAAASAAVAGAASPAAAQGGMLHRFQRIVEHSRCVSHHSTTVHLPQLTSVSVSVSQ